MNIASLYLPTLREWRAFLLGMREFRQSFTTAHDDADLELAYDCGREFAHVATFRRYED